ncbi:MAG: multidrug efflux SMR transporter [Asticcacaulis sp.]
MNPAYAYLALAICAEVVATSALKATEGFSKPLPTLITVVGYGIAFWMLSLCLKTIPVGIAYALWSGIGIVLISVVGWVVYRQSLDLAAIAGLGLILAGVAVINLFSKSVAH